NLAVAHTRAGDRAEGTEVMQRFQALRESGYGTTYSNTYLEQGRYAEAILSTGAEAGLVSRDVPALRYEPVTLAEPATDQPPAAGLNAGDLDGDGRTDLAIVEAGRVRIRHQAASGLADASAAVTDIDV